jgi:hypothetical protein
MENLKTTIKRFEIYRLSCKHEKCSENHDSENERIVIRIASRYGENMLESWGSCNPGKPSISGQTPGIIAEDLEERIAPFLLEKELDSVDSIFDILKHVSLSRKNMGAALTTVDTALFDMLGKLKNQPVYKLIRERLNLSEKTTDDANFSTILSGDSVLWGQERFKSIDELENYIDKLNVPPKIVVQPFHRDSIYLSDKLKKKWTDSGTKPRVFLDTADFTAEKIINIIKLNTAEGIYFNPAKDGGFSSLIEIWEILDTNPQLKLLVDLPCCPEISAITALNCAVVLSDIPYLLFSAREDTIPVLQKELDIIKNSPGTGYWMDMNIIEESALSASVIYCKNNRTYVRTFAYKNRKPDFRNVKEKII